MAYNGASTVFNPALLNSALEFVSNKLYSAYLFNRDLRACKYLHISLIRPMYYVLTYVCLGIDL